MLGERDASAHISACDLMLQPYPDGISTRRTSAMVGLAHGRALATTSGHLTESLWAESGAVAISPVNEPLENAGLVSHLLLDVEASQAAWCGRPRALPEQVRHQQYRCGFACCVMRIAVANFSSRRVGGAESYIEEVIAEFANSGHDVGLFVEYRYPSRSRCDSAARRIAAMVRCEPGHDWRDRGDARVASRSDLCARISQSQE